MAEEMMPGAQSNAVSCADMCERSAGSALLNRSKVILQNAEM